MPELKGKNIFFSPFSISTALAMTYAGARAGTQHEMATVLQFPFDDNRTIHSLFGSLLTGLANPGEGVKLLTANALWLNNNFSSLKNFIDTLKNIYGAELKRVDFSTDNREQAAQIINKWVENATERKIKELVPASCIHDKTRLILTNAIYFKGNWENQFDPKNTKDTPFHINRNQTVDIPMMYQSGKSKFEYFEGLGVKVADLPYVGNKLRMMIVVPDEIDGLPSLESQLAGTKGLDFLYSIASSPTDDEVKVYLPRFKSSSGFSVKQALNNMGMKTVFQRGMADFSGMAPGDEGKNVQVDDVLHKGFIDVNEEGTEASAATAVVISRGISRSKTVRADRPFFFFIYDKEMINILFVGRYVGPQA